MMKPHLLLAVADALEVFASSIEAITKQHPDQLALMRMLQRSPDGMTVRDIEKSPLGNTPWFKAWIAQNVKSSKDKARVVTLEEITNSDVALTSTEELPTSRELLDMLLEAAQPADFPYTPTEAMFPQNTKVIFDNVRVFALVVPNSEVAKLFAPWGRGVLPYLNQAEASARQSGHPYKAGHLVLAWVRYTDLGGDVLWVHEMQSDLFWVLGQRHLTQRDISDAFAEGGQFSKEFQYALRSVIEDRATDQDLEVRAIANDTFKEFIAANSSKLVVVPTPAYRMALYPKDMFGDIGAPVSEYMDIPRKHRFTKTKTKALNDAMQLDLPTSLQTGEVWVSQPITAK
jgi:hypothetical protein